jgi:hypothetical protein
MKAFLIDPAARLIEPVDFDGSLDAVRALIGHPSVDSDELDGGAGDRLFFDEECFLRGDAAAGRFQLDWLAPVSGRGLVTGRQDASGALGAAAIDLAALQSRVRFG